MTPHSIFISYRRADSQADVWKLHRMLSAVFGPEQVFLDHYNFNVGNKVTEEEVLAVKSAKVVLVVIGKGWIDARDKSGIRQLENEKDDVRLEVEAALETPGVTTIPVFLAHGTGVTKELLPAKMQDLPDRIGIHIQCNPEKHFKSDFVHLCEELKKHGVIPQPHPHELGDILDDLKNIIEDQRTDFQLMYGKPPSLAQCVDSAHTHYIPFKDKSKPRFEGFSYNHFFGISVIFDAAPNASSIPKPLLYRRARRPGEPSNLLRRGLSILLHASFKYRVSRETSPMDVWMKQVENDDANSALTSFARVPDGVLFKLLDYKIAISKVIAGECRPFAVITCDLRNTVENRVYTQYVFVANIRCVDDSIPLLPQFSMRNDAALHQAPSDLKPDIFLEGDRKDWKILDYLALRGLLGDENTIEVEGGRFSRGFRLVDS